LLKELQNVTAMSVHEQEDFQGNQWSRLWVTLVAKGNVSGGVDVVMRREIRKRCTCTKQKPSAPEGFVVSIFGGAGRDRTDA
jgi:hypothetical protein